MARTCKANHPSHLILLFFLIFHTCAINSQPHPDPTTILPSIFP